MKPAFNEAITECAAEVNLKHRLKNNKCADCNKVFNSHYDLVHHVKQYHPNGKAFKCNECGARFSNTQALSGHRRVINNLKQSHVCKFCSKSFIWKSNLKRHLSVHNKDCPYTCLFCTKTFKDKIDSKKHQLICAKTKHSCTFCEKTYKHDRGLRKHLVLHTGEKPYFCSVCEKSFTRKDILKKHQETHLKYKPNACNKDSLEKVHVCKFCSKTFDFESLLKYHLRVHTGERPYSCSICNRSYIRQKDLNKHKKKGHKQKSNVKDLTCKYCSKTFHYNSRLENHLKSHTNKSTFSCSLCGDVFKRKYSLKNHLNDHLERESKGCDNSKISNGKQNLNNFQNTSLEQEQKILDKDNKNSKANPKRDLNQVLLNQKSNVINTDKAENKIVCEFCSKTFKRSLQFKIHIKEHTKKKEALKEHESYFEQNPNYSKDSKELKTKNVCEYCSKTFKLISHLEKHLRVHNEEPCLSCSICEKSFKDKSTLNKHQKTHSKSQECHNDLKIPKQIDGKEISSKTEVNDATANFVKTCNKLSDDSQEQRKKSIIAAKCLKNDTNQNAQEATNLEIAHLEVSLDSNDLEIESQIESSQISNNPIVNKHSSTSINLYTNNTPPTKQIHKKYNIAERLTNTVFKPQLYRGLNRCFKVQDPSEQRNYPCFLCEKSYTESRLLKEHQKIHLKQKSKNVFKTLKIPQIVENPNNLNCINLVKPFNRVQRLNNSIHLQATNIKEEPCSDVEYQADNMESNSVLETIKTEYIDETPCNSSESECYRQNPIFSNVNNDLKCQFCYKIFTDSENLKKHIKLHFGDRFFSCSLCERSYTNKIDLNKHKKVHLKV